MELKKLSFQIVPKQSIKVFYDEVVIGEYFADILVEDKVIIEIKAAKNIADKYEAQLLSCLKVTDIEVGLLLSFGSKPEIKRKVFDNRRK